MTARTLADDLRGVPWADLADMESRRVPCDQCDASQGEACTAPTGLPTSPHSPRRMLAVSRGYLLEGTP